MAQQTQHPHNPCALPDSEQTPAKIWELLRRNACFQRTAARLQSLDQRIQSEDDRLRALDLRNAAEKARPEFQVERELLLRNRERAWEPSWRMVGKLEDRHAFAAVALQWLVPEPLFSVHRMALPKDVDLAGKEWVVLECVAYGEGTLPNPEDGNCWRWFERMGEFDAQSRANLAGHLVRRGPEINWTTSDDPRFADKINPITEWRDYFTERAFTLDTHWRDAPPGFKRHFLYLWRQLDSRGTNPFTRSRSDAPDLHEVTFFRDFSLSQTLLETADRGHLVGDALAHALCFADLADNYRVFAFPKSIQTRMAARDMAERLVEKLVHLPDGTQLPAREKVLLGTPLEWDIFLVVEEERLRGAGLEAALQTSFQGLYGLPGVPFVMPEAAPKRTYDPDLPPPSSSGTEYALAGNAAACLQKMQAEAWSARGASWEASYRTMDSPATGNGLVQRAFPDGKLFSAATILPSEP